MVLAMLTICLFCAVSGSGAADRPDEMEGRERGRARTAALQRRMHEGRAAKANAWAKARRAGMRTRGVRGRVFYELVGFENGTPLYYETYNENAAISTAANLLQILPYNLTASGVIVGVWDAGNVRRTHQEFGGLNSRVVRRNSEPNNPHATHVAGTIAAAGVVAQAKGMAPGATIWSYFMGAFGTSDHAQMEMVAATAPGQSDRLYLSNHSYGYSCGWVWYDSTSPEWVGRNLTPARDEKFGRYGPVAAAWDDVCYNAPYFLPFKAAGNDRDDAAPMVGQLFYRWESFGMQVQRVWYAYNPSVHPPADGAWLGGYDTVPDVSTAKNVMTVGAVEAAVSGFMRDPTRASVASFSAWGPTDDGRIKPDIVASGVSLYSPGWYNLVEPNNPLYVAESDFSYNVQSGTSMAAPNASGSAALLVELYGRLFPGQAMLSSTLKALIIHTADDLGNAGPDYVYGWGLMNAKAAADVIALHRQEPLAKTIYEGVLSGWDNVHYYTFIRENNSDVRVTLCWTDPAGTPTLAADDPSPRLVRDLDLRVVDSSGTLGWPYVLDRTNPN
ncbi:MAG TPA: S8 family serine peptidase, partial [Sedimentisphaerales bacterium]|nr:S8 family serine peptidase [Sedimentisphaerales bacterium]